MKSTSAIFAEGAIGLLRRALADGLCLDITVNATEARAVLTDARGVELARETRGGQLVLPLAPAVEAAPVANPVAPGRRVMRAGDLVVERISGGKTRDWIVREVSPKGPTLQRDDRPDLFETVTWAHISLDAADLWRLSSPHDPAEPEPSRGDGRPVEATSHNGVSVGDRLILDGVAVEVLGVDRDGFIWRATDGDDFEEGDVEWSAVRHVAANVWAPRAIVRIDVAEEPAVEAAPPAKKTRAKKARAPKAAPSTEPAAPVPHRLQAVTEADELAHYGEHSLIGLRGEAWFTVAMRAKTETAPEWQKLITEAAKTVRVRVYDRAGRCTWDSLDGNAEGYVHGGPA